jgi:AmiR/NasT family two-component response regulator
MANYDLTDAEAFQKLKHHSQDLNMKLQAIANEIVANHNRA